MEHTDKPASLSRSRSGEVHEDPAGVIALTVEDQDGDLDGILEKWSSEAWIYAPVDDLIELN